MPTRPRTTALLTSIAMGAALLSASPLLAKAPKKRAAAPTAIQHNLAKAAKRAIRSDRARRAPRRTITRPGLRLFHASTTRVQRLPDQNVRGRIAKPNVVIYLSRSFAAPTGLMSTKVWMPDVTPTKVIPGTPTSPNAMKSIKNHRFAR